MSFALALCDRTEKITFYNDIFADRFGKNAVEPGQTGMADLIAPEVAGRPQPVRPILGQKQVVLFRHQSGREFWGLLTCSDAGMNSDIYTTVIQVADIHALKTSHDTLEYRESTWRHAISDSKHGVWDCDLRTNTRFLSDEWKRLRGLRSDAEISGFVEEWLRNVHPEDVQNIKDINARLERGAVDSICYEYRERRPDGSWVWILSRGRTVEKDRAGKPQRIVGIDVDITETKTEEEARVRKVENTYQRHLAEIEAARKEAEEERQRVAVISNQDALTGLANRRAFSARLKDFIANAETGTGNGTGNDNGNGNGSDNGSDNDNDNGVFHLFLVDLDRFKPINDTYGHAVGDLVIREIAARIRAAVCDGSVVARLGGDEFGIIVPGARAVHAESGAGTMAENIVKAVRAPIHVNGVTLYTGASIGIASYPDKGRNETELMRRSDIAMYHAKKDASASVAFFHADMERRAFSRTELEADVRLAVEREEFRSFFQPIVDLANNRIAGFEVLARWPSAKHAGIGPLQFMPIIEQFGLMREFGSSILRQAIATAVNWGQDCRISLNVTAAGISNRQVAQRILNFVLDSGFPTDRVEIEISEVTRIKDVGVAAEIMAELRRHGVRFALDDFGVGYSGLSHLRTLSFDVLKLDRSFVSTMDSCDESKKIVRSVLALAEEFGMETVAEGIETDPVRRMVAEMGFTYGQGFLFGKAAPATEAEAMLDRQANALLQTG